MTKILLISILCLSFVAAQAQDTQREIIVRGDTLLLYGKLTLSPDAVLHRRFIQRLDSLKTPATIGNVRYSTIWRIDKDTLRLEGIYDPKNDTLRLPVGDIYPSGGAATWFSGEVRVAEYGNVVFTTGGDNTYHRHEVSYTIENGRITAAKKHRNEVIGSQEVFEKKTLPTIQKLYQFPTEPSTEGIRNLYIAFAATPDKRGLIKRFDLVRMVLYMADGTTERLDDPMHPYAQALLNELIKAEPYAVTIHGKIRPITGGVNLTPPQPTPKPLPLAAPMNIDSLQTTPPPSPPMDEAAEDTKNRP